eukprot:jgi/Mesvir1/21922/Mv01978-RA.1
MASMRAALALVLLLSVASYAAGQMCSYTGTPHRSNATTGRVRTDWLLTLAVDKFDRACGTLNSVSVNFTGVVTGIAGFESQELGITIDITLNLQARINMSYNSAPLFDVTPRDSVLVPARNITPFDGTIDFAGGSGKTYNDMEGRASQSKTWNAPAEVQTFVASEGSARAYFPTNAVALSRAEGGGNLVQLFNTFAQASITVLYVYTPIAPCSTEQMIMANPERCCRQLFFPELNAYGDVVRTTCCNTLIMSGGYDPAEASFPAPLRDNCCDICPIGAPPTTPECYRDYHKSCCAAAPFEGVPPPTNPWCVEPSIRSDPHFVAGNGLKYDFMGKAGETYCLFSDKTLHMNMHMIGVRGNPERKATWMDTISIMYYPFYNITISADSPEGTPFTAAHGTVTINGKAMKSQKVSFDVTDPAAVKGKNGEGVLEGSMADYVASDILAADCKVSQFVGAKSWTDAVVVPSVHLRSWTGEAGGDSNDDEDDTE